MQLRCPTMKFSKLNELPRTLPDNRLTLTQNKRWRPCCSSASSWHSPRPAADNCCDVTNTAVGHTPSTSQAGRQVSWWWGEGRSRDYDMFEYTHVTTGPRFKPDLLEIWMSKVAKNLNKKKTAKNCNFGNFLTFKWQLSGGSAPHSVCPHMLQSLHLVHVVRLV